MTAVLTIDESGQITLPETLRRVFGGQPGAQVKAEVTADRIEIVKEVPVAEATTLSSSGRIVLAPTGIRMDAGKAVREERDALAGRAAAR